MSPGNVTYVNPQILERVENQLQEVLKDTGAMAILLIERSGVVLATAGEPPLHPDQMGGVAAGVFGAMKTIMKASRAQDFVINVPVNGTCLEFHHIDNLVFLCAFYADSLPRERIRDGLTRLAHHALNSLVSEEAGDHKIGSTSFIEEKLNEMLDR